MSILDTIQFRIKDYNGKIKNKIYQLLIKRAAKTYSKIITISFTEKKKISHDLNLLVDKIKVIYLAQNINSRIIRDKKAIERIKNKYGIGNCFIFYVGGFDKRKNIDRLILAFEKLPIKYQLILAGNPSKYHLTKKLDKRIKFIGFVEQNDLPFLYNSAKLFVYPSVDEGFGIPPLDAMACGTPVITSKTEESKEIYGNSVIYFDPLSIESIEKSIRNATNDKKLLRKIRKKGLNMSKKFNWIKSAKKHLKILIEVNKNIK
jgi:glycosyltransferase involved in cell wall biosynthesis